MHLIVATTYSTLKKLQPLGTRSFTALGVTIRKIWEMMKRIIRISSELSSITWKSGIVFLLLALIFSNVSIVNCQSIRGKHQKEPRNVLSQYAGARKDRNLGFSRQGGFISGGLSGSNSNGGGYLSQFGDFHSGSTYSNEGGYLSQYGSFDLGGTTSNNGGQSGGSNSAGYLTGGQFGEFAFSSGSNSGSHLNLNNEQLAPKPGTASSSTGGAPGSGGGVIGGSFGAFGGGFPITCRRVSKGETRRQRERRGGKRDKRGMRAKKLTQSEGYSDFYSEFHYHGSRSSRRGKGKGAGKGFNTDLHLNGSGSSKGGKGKGGKGGYASISRSRRRMVSSKGARHYYRKRYNRFTAPSPLRRGVENKGFLSRAKFFDDLTPIRRRQRSRRRNPQQRRRGSLLDMECYYGAFPFSWKGIPDFPRVPRRPVKRPMGPPSLSPSTSPTTATPTLANIPDSTAAPTKQPTAGPTTTPGEPSMRPTSIVPTATPTMATVAPTMTTVAPTMTTVAPTMATVAPTMATVAPTMATVAPTMATAAPTMVTAAPTMATEAPTLLTAAPTTTVIAPAAATTAPTISTIAPTGATAGPAVATAAPSMTTSIPTMAASAIATTLSPTIENQTRFLDSTLSYAFFNDTVLRMPVDLEISGLINKTIEFYQDVFDDRYPNEFNEFQIELENWTYDPTAELPVVVDFVATIDFLPNSTVLPSVDVLFATMQDANYEVYIEQYVWEAAPTGTIFFDVMRTRFRAREGLLA